MPKLTIDPDEATPGDDLAAVADALAERDDDTLPEVIEQLYDVIGQRERRTGSNAAARRKLADASDAYDSDRPRAAWNRVAQVLKTLS